MQLRTLCNVRGLNLLKDHFSFYDINLVNGLSDGLSKTFFDDFFLQQAGMQAGRRFLNKPFFFELSELHEFSKDKVQQSNNNSHSFISQFINFLWFVKDHSVNVLSAYAYIPELSELLVTDRHTLSSNCIGEFENSSFSLEELRTGFKIFDKMFTLITPVDTLNKPIRKENSESSMHGTDFNYRPYNSNNRIERAITFLNMARGNSFLPLKISFYICIIECLFTTETNEISHQASANAATYLGGSPDNIYNNFKLIKSAYTLRSKFFHGQVVTKEYKSASELSRSIDSILRQILIKVIMQDSSEFLGSVEALKKYLHGFVFRTRYFQ